jgi:uncharacterized membrane protein required for colicin V production
LTAYFRGFVKTVLGLFSVVVSCVLAFFATNHFTPRVCEQIVYPVINGAIGQYIPNGMEEKVVSVGVSVPGGLEEKLMESVGGAIGQMALNIAEAAGRQISQSLADSVTRIVLFLLFFVLFSVLFRIIVFIVDTICHLPVLNILNRLAGFLVGLVQGTVLAGLFCIVLSFIVITYKDSPQPLIKYIDIESTIVTHYIYNSALIQPFLFN